MTTLVCYPLQEQPQGENVAFLQQKLAIANRVRSLLLSRSPMIPSLIFELSVRGLPDLTVPSRRLWTNQLDRGTDDGDEPNSDVLSQSRSARRVERVHRRMRRAAGGSRGQSKQSDGGPSSNDFSAIVSPGSNRHVVDSANRDIAAMKTVSVLRPRRAKPCSYCHVPYHHRIAPFSNMKLVPCLLCGE
jgi:uncharacterized protein (DUF3084 family)